MFATTTLLAQAADVTKSVEEAAKTSTNAVLESFQNAWIQTVAMVPSIVGMLIVLVAGYFVAKFVGRLVVALAEKIGLETAAERSGLAESMKQVGIQRNVAQIVGLVGFWLLMSVFIMAAFSILQLDPLTSFMEEVVGYIPRILAAMVILVLGLLLATFIRGVVGTAADRAGLGYAETLGNVSYYFLAIMTFIAALAQVGIEIPVMKETIMIAMGGLAIGFALAFGLGGRDVIGGILAGYYVRQRLHAGDQVTVAGFEGTIRDVGPTATVIETEEDGLMHRHSIPNVRMLNEAVR
ncbi:MAG: mechanosensitive ion channel [Pirellulales bacterium]|nr:mechanosensitive ion channel [Pirellulales bacterium]